MKKLLLATLAALAVAWPTPGQDVYPRGRRPTPTEAVVQKYLKLIVQGALLTPQGWKTAGELFTEAKPYPANGTIYLWSPGYVGDWSIKGDTAQVATKWADEEGSIDSSLRYIPPPKVYIIGHVYQLQLLGPHQSAAGGTPSEKPAGDASWKIKGPLTLRTASVEQAIVYLQKKRDATTDPSIRKNAEKTIATLKAILHAPPSPC
jgi:hypothetical protein